MSDDPATEPAADRRATLRRRRVVASGHGSDEALARASLHDNDPAVAGAALGALARLQALTVLDVCQALSQGPVVVRRRAADLARTVRGAGSRSTLLTALTTALDDPDPLVVVHAAWFLGERRAAIAVPALTRVGRDHDDTRCREAAVAALGAIGDPAGMATVVAAAGEDRPTVRRRATVALAGFDDPGVDDALRRAAADRDWQVRQAAEELLDG